MIKYRVKVDDRVYQVEVEKIESKPDADEHKGTTSEYEQKENGESAEQIRVKAPLAGTIISVNARVGQKVDKDEVLLTLEALKLENEITAPKSGTVEKIVSEGESVETDQIVAIIK